MQGFGTEKAIVFRQPATANLMIDSADRDETIFSSPWDYQITKRESIQNGYMTRIGTTEVVLEWCEPNISAIRGNNTIIMDISATAGDVFAQTITFPSGFYTVAEALDYLAEQLTDLSGTTGARFEALQEAGGATYIVATTGTAELKVNDDTALSEKLGLDATPNYQPALLVSECADIRPYRYIDFTSSQLTYCQDLKDNSTTPISRDVLCRWYMAWDQPPEVDIYGFPILMGYTKFVARRLFNPPKQIKWDTNQPIGNLAFQVYDENGDLLQDLSGPQTSNWLMTLQLSEN